MSLFKRHFFASLLLSFLIAPASAESLRLVTDTWAPYVFEKDGQPTGLDYEITREVLQRLGFELELQILPWKRCLLAMEQGHADGILDIFHNAQREASMQFVAEPLSEVELVLFFAHSHPHLYQRPEDLQGLTIGVSPGYWYSDETFRTSMLFQREEAGSHEANLGKLIRHRIDLVVNDRRAGLFLAKALGLDGEIAYNPTPVSRDLMYLALRKTTELQALAKDFADELRRFKGEPAYQALQRRYTEPLFSTP